MSVHPEDVCETFTHRGYERLQEAALGTNQAENPLIPAVTIRRAVLARYARWAELEVWKTQFEVSGI